METEIIHQCDELLIDITGFGAKFLDLDCSKYECISHLVDEDLSTHLIYADLKYASSIELFFACTLKVWLENWGYKESPLKEAENEYKKFIELEGSSVYSRISLNEFEKLAHSDYLSGEMTSFLTSQFLADTRLISVFSGNENQSFLISNSEIIANLELS